MRRKITKRLISIMMAVVMLLSLFPFSAFADEVTASDLDGHWAEQVMQEWMGYGIVAGYEDGTVRPDRSITRAEMTAMLDRVMDYQTKAANPFTDLDDAWYTEVVLKANAAGVISGYPDNTVRPNATISRQEAVAMFARVLSLDTTNAPEADFTDNDAVADWAKDAVNAMAAAGYIHGSDGQFRPDAGITRAEVITIFNNIFDKLYAKAGTYTGDVNGSAVVSADGVTLENMHIKGDLIIAEGVGDGHVELDNVTVDGQLIVRGGGENSIIIKGDSQIGTISIERKDGAVRVAVENGANVSMIAVNDGSNGVKIEGNVTTLNVANIDADVTVDGTIDNLNVSGPRATVTISGSVENIAVEDNAHDATLVINKDATVDTLKTSAENTTIVTNGDIDTVTIGTSAPGATITVESTGAIGNVTTSASGTTVEGEGSVDKVEVTENASDTTITTSGTTIENNSDEAVSIGNGDTIASGTTGTTPDGEANEPEQPSTPTPQPPVHTHTYVDGICTSGDAYDPSWAQVNSVDTWNAAVEAGRNIILTADFTTSTQLDITTAITVNGNGHTITAANDVTWSTENGSKHLVLIQGDNANNVTLKNITLNSNNKAHGLQAYCVTDTTLQNVTLTNSVGAGLTVNGATVTATGLTTSSNAWGGVNVDQGTGVTDTTSFTFDATSTFAENTPVYSDNGTTVTVNAPEGYAGVNASGTKYVWTKLFAGGNGTAENPYLIGTAEEFSSIVNGVDADHILYYQLTDDIDLNGCDRYGVYLASNIVVNGDDHRIYSSVDGTRAYGVFCYVSGNTTLKNITYDLTNFDCYGNTPAELDLTGFIYEAQGLDANITIDNVKIEGSHSVNSNNAPYVMNEFLVGTSTLTFKNCEMAASLSGDGYNACFIGWQGKESTVGSTNETCDATITLDNCTVSGELVCPKAAIVTANGSNAATRTYNYSGTNTLSGTIRGTEVAKYFTAVSETDKTSFESAAVQAFTGTGQLYVGNSDENLAISVGENGTLTVTPSSNSSVNRYVVSVGLYTNLYNAAGGKNGTWKYFAEQTVTDLSNLTLKAYNFIDAGYSGLGEVTTDSNGNKIASLNETTYYVVQDLLYPDESGLQGYVGSPSEPGIRSASIIQVSAYIGDTLYSTATAH